MGSGVMQKLLKAQGGPEWVSPTLLGLVKLEVCE